MAGDLIVPIYIDTNSLLDLLASIEGGFSVVEKVTTQSLTSRASSVEGTGEVGTEFGIPNVLSLLKINLGLSKSKQSGSEDRQQREAEKYHTYGSLLFRLREYLDSHDLIKRLETGEEDWQEIRVSDFVEIHGAFQPNPLAGSLETFDRLFGILNLLSGDSGRSPKRQGPDKRQPSQPQQNLASVNPQQLEQIRKFIRGILDDIEQERIRTFVVDVTGLPRHRAVAIMFIDYLRDKTMTEINYKEFYLFGKVVRKIEATDESGIDLLSGTGLRGVGEDVLKQMVDALSSVRDANLPKIQTLISGPALEIVPIAVFV